MLDSRVVEIAKALLGEQLVYYRQSDIAFEEVPGPATHSPYRELHCDARGSPQTMFGSWNPSGPSKAHIEMVMPREFST